jgi:hypothetical protein
MRSRYNKQAKELESNRIDQSISAVMKEGKNKQKRKERTLSVLTPDKVTLTGFVDE